MDEKTRMELQGHALVLMAILSKNIQEIVDRTGLEKRLIYIETLGLMIHSGREISALPWHEGEEAFNKEVEAAVARLVVR